MISNDFQSKYPFTALKDSSWNKYLITNEDPRKLKDWVLHKNIVSQICKNRWSEGIYDISIDSIISNKVKINQGDVPVLTEKLDFSSILLLFFFKKPTAKISFDSPLIVSVPFNEIC